MLEYAIVTGYIEDWNLEGHIQEYLDMDIGWKPKGDVFRVDPEFDNREPNVYGQVMLRKKTDPEPEQTRP